MGRPQRRAKLAYVILAHKLPDQVIRLVDRLDSPSASFFLHVDGNTDDALYAEIAGRLASRPNVSFLKRIPCRWGDWSLVKATCEGIKQAVQTSLAPDHVILLSGQDYPLKRPEEIEDFFAGQRGMSFIHHRPFPDFSWRVGHWPYDGGIPLLKSQVPPPRIELSWGSQWWALSGGLAAYIGEVVNENRELIEFFEGVVVPDEMFFQTVAVNSPFRDRLRHAGSDPYASPSLTDCLLGAHYIDWLRGHPKILGCEDFERLIASPALFARKFDGAQDSFILDVIDAHLDRGTSSSIDSRAMVAPVAHVQPPPANGMSGTALTRSSYELTEATIQESGLSSAASQVLEHVVIELRNECGAWKAQANGHDTAIAMRTCRCVQGKGTKKKRRRKAAQRQE